VREHYRRVAESLTIGKTVAKARMPFLDLEMAVDRFGFIQDRKNGVRGVLSFRRGIGIGSRKNAQYHRGVTRRLLAGSPSCCIGAK
jgi:hypothetical protein